MFIGLHRHSHYSKRDAIAKIPDMVNRITNIKFIFGCEAYWVPDYYIKDRKQSCHIILLAKNRTGYRTFSDW